MSPASNPELFMSLGIIAVAIGAIGIVLWQVTAIKKLSLMKLNKKEASSRGK